MSKTRIKIEDLKEIKGSKLLCESLKNYTSFKTGGIADAVIFPFDTSDIRTILSICKKKGILFYIIGLGTNLLVSDNGFRGIIIKLGESFKNMEIKNNGTILVDAGVNLASVASLATENSLHGLEFSAGIPGSFGGAISMNAGTDCGEIKDIVKYINIVTENGAIKKYTKKDIEFNYRSTNLPKNSIITSGEISLEKGDKEEIRHQIKHNLTKRKNNQPTSSKCAGSIFKNPSNDYAGRLIEKSGLKGFRVGGAVVSTIHSNFIINDKRGTSNDILNLIKIIKDKVYKDSGIILDEEVKIIGEK